VHVQSIIILTEKQDIVNRMYRVVCGMERYLRVATRFLKSMNASNVCAMLKPKSGIVINIASSTPVLEAGI